MNRQEAIALIRELSNYADSLSEKLIATRPEIDEAVEMAIDALNHQTVFEQIKWERDVALQTLEEHGIGLGQKSDWIPVSERLPEVGSEVLVCFDFKCNRSVYISSLYSDGEFHGLDDEYLTPDGRKYRKAVAWRPLPAPYKESEDIQEEKIE